MDGQVLVVARARLRAGEAARFFEAVAPFVAETRREPGCLEYDLYVSATEFEEITTVERWSNAAAVAQHMQAPHTQRFLHLAGLCFAAPRQIRTLAVSSPASRCGAQTS